MGQGYVVAAPLDRVLAVSMGGPAHEAPAPGYRAAPGSAPNEPGVPGAAGRQASAPLLAALQAGDHQAWEVQYRAVYPGLLAFARRRLDADDARDAVSETMARAVQTVGRFESRGVSFDAWLYGILRNVVADIRRKSVRRLHRFYPQDEVFDVEPGEGLFGREEAVAVRRAFDRLSAADQELLELRVVQGLSAEDVAAVLGKRAGAVRMSQSRALQRLRVELERTDDGR